VLALVQVLVLVLPLLPGLALVLVLLVLVLVLELPLAPECVPILVLVTLKVCSRAGAVLLYRVARGRKAYDLTHSRCGGIIANGFGSRAAGSDRR
jgi:hypothetical protein